MEEQRKKAVSSSPLTSADQLNDGTYDSSINDPIYEDDEEEEDSGSEEHGPTTSESEPLDLTHRKINARRVKRFTNSLSEDVLSQFIVRRNLTEMHIRCFINVPYLEHEVGFVSSVRDSVRRSFQHYLALR